MTKLEAKIADLSLEALQEMALALNSDFRDGADLVFSAVLNALEARMAEAEFVAFCDHMDD